MKNYLIHNLCSLEKEDGLFKMRIIERILLSYEGIEEKDTGVNFINTKFIATDPLVKIFNRLIPHLVDIEFMITFYMLIMILISFI